MRNEYKTNLNFKERFQESWLAFVKFSVCLMQILEGTKKLINSWNLSLPGYSVLEAQCQPSPLLLGGIYKKLSRQVDIVEHASYFSVDNFLILVYFTKYGWHVGLVSQSLCVLCVTFSNAAILLSKANLICKGICTSKIHFFWGITSNQNASVLKNTKPGQTSFIALQWISSTVALMCSRKTCLSEVIFDETSRCATGSSPLI